LIIDIQNKFHWVFTGKVL